MSFLLVVQCRFRVTDNVPRVCAVAKQWYIHVVVRWAERFLFYKFGEFSHHTLPNDRPWQVRLF